MPTQFIHEDHVTFGNDLFFPNVQSCAAIIVQTDGSTEYGGYHITIGSKQVELEAACQHITTSLAGTVCRIYVIGNYKRTGASGAGSNSMLGDALRTALQTACPVHYLQSPDDWFQGIAVHVQNGAPQPVLELRIAPPGKWATGPNANTHRNMLKVRSNGGTGAQPFPLPTATFNGVQKPWGLGSLEVG